MMSLTDQAPVTPGSSKSESGNPAYDSLNAHHALSSRFKSCCRPSILIVRVGAVIWVDSQNRTGARLGFFAAPAPFAGNPGLAARFSGTPLAGPSPISLIWWAPTMAHALLTVGALTT